MNDLNRKALDRIEQARVALVLMYPFFSVLALRLLPEPDARFKTFATNGQCLKFNPAYVVELTDAEIAGVIAHETLHCGFGHIWRRGGREKRKWNVAADIVVNEVVLEAGFTLPKGAIIDESFAGQSAERVYASLPDQPSGDGEGDGDFGCGEVLDADEGLSAEQDVANEAEWQVAVLQAAQAAKMMGKLPASLERLVDQIKHPAVDWRAALRRFVEQQQRSDYTWQTPNRRFIASGLYLPSLRSESMPPLACVIDTSGSISQQMITAFASEIQSIADECQPEALHIIYADAEVHGADEFARGEEIKLKPKGFGGTDFRPAFEWIKKQDINPACIIYLTDAQGEFPCSPPDVAVLWAVTGKSTVPFGERLQLQEEI